MLKKLVSLEQLRISELDPKRLFHIFSHVRHLSYAQKLIQRTSTWCSLSRQNKYERVVILIITGWSILSALCHHQASHRKLPQQNQGSNEVSILKVRANARLILMQNLDEKKCLPPQSEPTSCKRNQCVTSFRGLVST